MSPRAKLLAALFGLILPLGCARHAPPPKPPLAPLDPSAETSPRTFKIAPPPAEKRPSEDAPVTEDRPDPEAQRLFEARIAQPAIPLAPAVTPPRVTEIALDDTRRGEAPGMKAAGAILAATLAEGQRATLPVQLAPGECETFIAQGGLGVIEVDLFLTAGDGAKGRILAEDPASGPIAVIGGRGKCIAGARETGTTATLHAAVRRGAGVVLVRAFRR